MNKLEELYKEIEINTDANPSVKAYILDLIKTYTTECVKASLENASENLRQASGTFNSDYSDQKRSINNPDNIVLL